MDKIKLVRAIKQLAIIIDKMDDTEIAAFFEGVQPRNNGKPKRIRRPAKGEVPDPAILEEYITRLRAAESRESALDYLDDLRLTRRELTDIARRAHVHITKEDTVGEIEEKIVEAMVGSRLNSLAIRGREPQLRGS